MRARPTDPELLARVGRWLLAAEVVVAALALGSLHTGVLAGVAALAGLAAGLVWYGSEPLRARPAATALVVLVLILLGWTAFTVVPLPRAVLAFLAPANADVWARALSPLREPGPSFAPISLDPIATRVELLRGVTYLFTLLAALRVANGRSGVVFLERALVTSGVVMAVGAMLHPATGTGKVFGLYEPAEAFAYDQEHLAPLLNTNHLAAYMNIGFSVALGGLVQRREPALPRSMAGAAALLMVATNLWARSRGGAAALVLATLLVAALTVWVRRRERVSVLPVLAAVVVSIGAVVMATVAMFDASRAKFQHRDTSKLDLIANAFDLLREHAVFGIGRGAFESVFPAVRRGGGHWLFTHPENVIAQLTVEWGVPFALLTFGTLAWALRPRTMLARSQPPIGAWAALVVVALHNLVDFSSEVPGVMVALAVCAGIVTGGSGGGRGTASRVELWSSRPRLVGPVAAAFVGLAALLTLPSADHELQRERRAFRDRGAEGKEPASAFEERARAAMLRHPAEPYFPFMGALDATLRRSPKAIAWASRALDRSPVYGRVHLLLARGLFGRNPAQARLEYRLAASQEPSLRQYLLGEAVPLVHSYDDALELAEEGEPGVEVLEGVSVAVAPRLPSTAVRIDQEILRRAPTAPRPLRRAAEAAIADLVAGARHCGEGGAVCLAEGRAAVEKLKVASSGSCEAPALLAELDVATGHVDEALSSLERALDVASDRSACVRKLVSLARASGQKARAGAALDRLVRLGCTAPSECVDNLLFAADTEAASGNDRRALAFVKRAVERAPERDDLLERMAQMAEKAGLYGEALAAYAKLEARRPNEPRHAAGAARAREAAQRSLVPTSLVPSAD